MRRQLVHRTASPVASPVTVPPVEGLNLSLMSFSVFSNLYQNMIHLFTLCKCLQDV